MTLLQGSHMPDLDPDDLPHRRRLEDSPLPSADLIIYQLGELKAAMTAGFERIDGRFTDMDKRVGSLERFREREEERARVEAMSSQMLNSRWLPLGLALVSIAVTVTLFVIKGT